MRPINRSDLSWALKAVLPHTGDTFITAGVGLYQNVAWATDGYTLGIVQMADAEFPWCELPTKEATELERFVRPKRVPHKTEEVIYRRVDNELHIGLTESEDTAVFDLFDSGILIPLGACIKVLDIVNDETPANFVHCPYNPDFLARFATAKRDETDRLWLSQRHRDASTRPDALVTVGEHFIGLIAGLSLQSGYGWPTEPDSSFYVALRAAERHSEGIAS